MGAGRPIVSTVDGEARQVLEQANAGLFVPPEDPERLARAIRQLAADPERRQQLGAAGRRHVETHYSRPVLAQRYLDVLEALRR